MRAAFVAIPAAIFLFFISTFFGSWYTIDEGEVGVLTRNGAVTGVATPGLGFKLPFVDGVEKISTRTEIIRVDKGLEAYSQDQQAANMVVSVNYSIVGSQAREVYSQYGSAQALADRLIKPRLLQQLKNVFGRYTASTAISKREALNNEVRAALQAAVQGPVTIEGVQLEDISFSREYTAAIEARMKAEVEVQRIRQQAEQAKVTAEITVTNAKATADSNLAVAEAEAKATRIKGEAEAAAIKARGDALRDNPGLVALTQAERWDGKLPSTMVPGNAVPMLGMK